MKRYHAFVLIIAFLLAFSGCAAESVSYFYSDAGEIDGVCIAVNKLADCCFAGPYECTKFTEDFNIVIPDDYNGIPITRIGGYIGSGAPSPFKIHAEALYMNAPTGSEFRGVYTRGVVEKTEVAYSIENVEFHLSIGKNINTIDLVDMDNYYPHINTDGSITFYHPVVNIACSDENMSFYSENGKLYYKSNGQLVTEFSYAN